MPSTEQTSRLNNIQNIIIPLCYKTSYSPLVLTTQWILESGYGTKQSGVNNVLGITWTTRSPFTYSWVKTWEHLTSAQIRKLPREEAARVESITPIEGKDDLFKVVLQRRFNNYDTVDECLEDKIDLIVTAKRYRPSYLQWLDKYRESRSLYSQERDLTLLSAICKAGYATDIKYQSTVLSIAKQKSTITSITTAIPRFTPKGG